MQIQRFLSLIMTVLSNFNLDHLSTFVTELTDLSIGIGFMFLCMSLFLWVYKKKLNIGPKFRVDGLLTLV